MSAQRPASFTCDYNGEPLVFERVDIPQFRGYSFKCPKCAKETPEHFGTNWIDTDSGTRHSLSFDEIGRANIIGSILCLTKYADKAQCGWHVEVKNAIVRDL